MTNPRATETILRQFVDSGAIPFEERVSMERGGFIFMNGNRFELTPAGKAVLYGWSDVKNAESGTKFGESKMASPKELEQVLLNNMTRSVIDATQFTGGVEPPKTTLETQIGGDHYKKLGQYQPWQVCAACMTPAELRGYMKGTVIAYLMREQDKGGDLDIKKAAHTIQLWEEVRKDK